MSKVLKFRLAELERQKDIEHIKRQQQLKDDKERREMERQERLIAIKNREKVKSQILVRDPNESNRRLQK